MRFPNIVYSCFWLFVPFISQLLTNKSQRKRAQTKFLLWNIFSMEFHLEKNQGILACCCVSKSVYKKYLKSVYCVWFWKGVGMKSLMWIMIHQVAVLVIKNDKNDWLQPTLWSRTKITGFPSSYIFSTNLWYEKLSLWMFYIF